MLSAHGIYTWIPIEYSIFVIITTTIQYNFNIHPKMTSIAYYTIIYL